MQYKHSTSVGNYGYSRAISYLFRSPVRLVPLMEGPKQTVTQNIVSLSFIISGNQQQHIRFLVISSPVCIVLGLL